MSLWKQVRRAFISMWADIPRPSEDARIALLTWLGDACTAERRLAAQLRRDAATMPYEAFRSRLEAMAHEDEHHASLLRERIKALRGVREVEPSGSEAPLSPEPAQPWRRLQRMLAEKRELYERYRQQASATDDADLGALLRQLHHREEVHQDQVVDLLMKVDSHVHSG